MVSRLAAVGNCNAADLPLTCPLGFATIPPPVDPVLSRRGESGDTEARNEGVTHEASMDRHRPVRGFAWGGVLQLRSPVPALPMLRPSVRLVLRLAMRGYVVYA